MSRALPTVLVVALVAASLAALASGLQRRREPTPIVGSAAGALFSPLCECPRDHVRVSFLLRRPETATVTVRRRGGGTVAELASRRSYPAGWAHAAWSGIQPSGIAAPDGAYVVAVHLERDHRTIVLPETIRIDTEQPRVVGVQPRPLLLSPDGDGRGDAIVVRYRLRGPGRGLLLVDGRIRARAAAVSTSGSLAWNGRVRGVPLPPGPHPLRFAAEDEVGNRTRPQRIGTLTIRYVTLARHLVSIGPGERFYILASADARRLDWRFAGRSGRVRPGTLVLRAPRRTGRYRLLVRAGAHVDAATVKVERVR